MSRRNSIIIGVVAVILANVIFFLFVYPSLGPRPDRGAAPEAGAPETGEAPAGPAIPAASGQRADTSDDFHIGIVTSSSHQGIDSLKGVEAMEEKYGVTSGGGRITAVTYPDNFLSDFEKTVETIEALADDPQMKVIFVTEGVPGTASAFTNIRKRRPDIVLLVAESHEDVSEISVAADLVVNADFITRGYTIPYGARMLGAKTFVHVSFPRHMIDESLSRQRGIMEKASQELGIGFAFENAPDPTGEAGLAGAQTFIREHIPLWLEKYGPDTAFYTTNNGHTAPMIEGVIRHGGYFVEADEPSPLLGYPEALGIGTEELEKLEDDWPALLDSMEKAIVEAGAGGRLGTWTTSLSYSHVVAMTEFGRLVALGQVGRHDTKRLLELYDETSRTTKWNGALYTGKNEEEVGNVFLIFQDTYIFGRGYLGTTSLEIPLAFRAKKKAWDRDATPPPYTIALITGDENQGGEDLMGAREMVRLYGDEKDGGLIKHVIYGDEFIDDVDLTAAMIEDVARDPRVRVIVVNQAIAGTAEGFRRAKAINQDVICLSGEPHESPDVISQEADLVVAGDFISRGYLLPYSARQMGIDTFVHVSFDRHLSYSTMRQRLRIMEEASKDLGLEFAMEEAPDPIGEAGYDGATAFLMEAYPKWLEKYGPNTAFFATNDAHTEPILKQMAAYGGYFIEADIPSTLLGYPKAFDLNVEPFLGQWTDILNMVEKAVVDAGGGGRMGTWVYPLGYTQSAGLTEFGKLLAEGKTTITDIDTLVDCLGIFSPGARWKATFYNDPLNGKPLRNYLLVYQDTYILGKGYIETTKIEIPEKYYSIPID
ncbi:MAG: DUF3798 domain-containing protein [Deltaproteobacteria bacterium]|jgi:hypothetical protein|nr:DUF3798 domain-containing protein [Deltaproteobacteria bacterium]